MTRLNVVSWNVHWGVARVPHRPKGQRFDPLQELDHSLPEGLASADIVVMPEAWRAHDGSSFLDRFGAFGFDHVVETVYRTLKISAPRRELEEPGEGWWELAVASRHPIISTFEIPLARSFDDAVPIRNARSIRIAPAGREIDVTAFHPSSKLWYGAPVQQLRSLAGALRSHEIDGRHRPAIIAGDANMWRTWLPALLPGWRLTARGRTFPSWKPHSQIDHILLRGAIDEVASCVLPYSPTSDHRAVMASVRLR